MSTIKLAQCIQAAHLRSKTASPFARLLGRKASTSTLSPGMRKALLLGGGAAGLGAGAVAGRNVLVDELADRYLQKIVSSPKSLPESVIDIVGSGKETLDNSIGGFIERNLPFSLSDITNKAVEAKESLDNAIGGFIERNLPLSFSDATNKAQQFNDAVKPLTIPLPKKSVY